MSEKNEFVQITLNFGSDVQLSQAEVNALVNQLQAEFKDLRAGPIDVIRKNVSPSGTPKGEPFITLGVAVLQFVVPKLIEIVYEMIKQRHSNRMKVVAQLGSDQIRMDSQTDANQFQKIKGQIQAAADVEQVPDRKYALLIGMTHYQDGRLNQLTSPEVDVRNLAEILKDPDIGGYDEVKLFLNQSSASLQQAIEQFYKRKASTDLLLLYYSGHGIKGDEEKLYLAAENTDLETIRSTSLPSDFIIGEMDRSKSERQILILDCCYSGAFMQRGKGMGSGVGVPVNAESVFKGNGYGRVILTASDKTQIAFEGEQVKGQVQKSVFTAHLIEGLQTGEADHDRDGWVGLDELYKFVFNRMVRQSAEQTPLLSVLGMKGSIYLTRNPRPKPEALPDELQVSLRNTNFPNTRQAAVQDLCELFRGPHFGLALAARKELEKLVNDDSQRISQLARQALGMDVAGGFWGPTEPPSQPNDNGPQKPAWKEPDPPPGPNVPAQPWWTVLKAPPGTRSSGNPKSGPDPDQASMISDSLNMFGSNSPFAGPQNQAGALHTNASFTSLPVTAAPLQWSQNRSPDTARRALIVGIFSLLLFVIPLLPVLGIVLGVQATRENPQSSQAKTGLVLSVMALGLQLFLLLVIFLI